MYSGVKSKVAGNLKSEAKANMRKSLARYQAMNDDSGYENMPVTWKAAARLTVGNAYTSPSPKKKLSAAKSSSLVNSTAARTTASPSKAKTMKASQPSNALIMETLKQKYDVEDIAKMSVDQLQNEIVPEIL